MPSQNRNRLQPRNAHGFTLVEVLVALSILVTTLGVIYQLLSTGHQQAEEAKKATVGLTIAQSITAEYGQSQVPDKGYIDGYYWTVSLSDFKPNALTDNAQNQIKNPSTLNVMEEHARQRNPIKLTKIDVTVSWKSNRGQQQVSLVTLRPLKGGNR